MGLHRGVLQREDERLLVGVLPVVTIHRAEDVLGGHLDGGGACLGPADAPPHAVGHHREEGEALVGEGGELRLGEA